MNQKEMPLVSVVIPTYSRNDTLCTAIDSVLAQSYQNFEILIVDDNLINIKLANRLLEGYKVAIDSAKSYAVYKRETGMQFIQDG